MRIARLLRRIFLLGLVVAAIGYHAFALYAGRTGQKEGFRSVFADWGYILRYHLGQTPDLVIKGRDPRGKLQLFHRGELAYQRPSSARHAIDWLGSQMKATIEWLSRSGVEIVFVAIPTKLSLHRSFVPGELPLPDRWSKEPDAAESEDAIEAHRALTRQLGLRLVDLYWPYEQFRRENAEASLYPPLDYHWSSLGIGLAVTALVQHLRARGLGFPEVQMERAEPKPFGPSYLTDQFPIPHWYVERRAELQSEEARVHLTPAGKYRHEGRVFLAGTSFSASEEPFSFAYELGRALGTRVTNFSYGNGGFSGAVRKLIDSGYQPRRGDVLVWELALCCLNLDASKLPPAEAFRAQASMPN